MLGRERHNSAIFGFALGPPPAWRRPSGTLRNSLTLANPIRRGVLVARDAQRENVTQYIRSARSKVVDVPFLGKQRLITPTVMATPIHSAFALSGSTLIHFLVELHVQLHAHRQLHT